MHGEKEKSNEEKRRALVAKFFCGHAYLTDLIGHRPIRKRVNREEKSFNDWTNWHILEQINREEKKDKTVSSLLIKILWSDEKNKSNWNNRCSHCLFL